MTDVDLDIATLHGSLGDRALSSMNFLNQIASEYPDAISFAAGRPYEGFYDPEHLHHYLRLFRAHLEHDLGYDEREVTRTLFQYGRTKGIINDLVARQLATDEQIIADPESIVVTVGCQEALFLVLRALRATADDVVLAPVPTYVGLTGAARLADLPVHPVRTTGAGLDLDDLVAGLYALRAAGRRPRAIYVTPDFANPTGVSMTVADRHRLLDIADREDVLLLEDNAYGLLADDRLPTLKSLDRHARVVYLGSFAKTGLPGARVGFAIADQKVTGGGIFADELSKIKSMLTVNTPPVAQAVIGGRLLAGGGSLVAANEREIAVYRANLRQVLDGLARRFSGDVSWNTPTGGFFVTLTVPFRADDGMLAHSARVHGVLWTPMHHFYGGTGGFHELRLSCSVLTHEAIEVGLDRLAKFFEEIS
ncbi:PLP-dependent aminotransferase family protein [Amycolatopsis taiwanensis]|uniref:aminotransferase-like domain-containing protein n=1 Tax=Amycolatopsis taiwanensis TaxID=342230 RepID=UPI0004B44461|nr:PLP-dependent aminotransferase family protein [Amycolatopsis taiwanensis]